jgi:nucleotide-binding universal stress UspA family protein
MKLRTILVATDFSPIAGNAVRAGLEIARAVRARVILCHAVPHDIPLYGGVPGMPVGYRSEIEESRRRQLARDWRRLEALAVRARRQGIEAATAFAEGDPPETIVRFARRRRADLVVVATHGRGGAAHLLLGSVSEKVARNAPCPVLIVRKARLRPAGPVLIAVDESKMARVVARAGAAIATRLRSRAVVVHALRETAIYEDVYGPAIGREVYREISAISRKRAEKKILALLRAAGIEGGARALHLREGRPQDVIVKAAAQLKPRLTVVGTHGRKGLTRALLGSVSEAVVRRASSPVLVIRGRG